MILSGHFQNAYITRDLDKAMAQLKAELAIDQFMTYEGEVQVTTPKGTGPALNRLAFAWLGNLQYELIQPVSGLVDVYAEALPADDSLRFHHICMRILDWDALLADIERDGRQIV